MGYFLLFFELHLICLLDVTTYNLAAFLFSVGPLGQGICNAVGLAVAEAHLASRFNKPDVPPIVDHYT